MTTEELGARTEELQNDLVGFRSWRFDHDGGFGDFLVLLEDGLQFGPDIYCDHVENAKRIGRAWAASGRSAQ